MQNIGKTDINSPGSTSQQEHRQERPLKAVRNRRQVRLSAETKEVTRGHGGRTVLHFTMLVCLPKRSSNSRAYEVVGKDD